MKIGEVEKRPEIESVDCRVRSFFTSPSRSFAFPQSLARLHAKVVEEDDRSRKSPKSRFVFIALTTEKQALFFILPRMG